MPTVILGIVAFLVIASGTIMLLRRYLKDQKAHRSAIEAVKKQRAAEAAKEKTNAGS